MQFEILSQSGSDQPNSLKGLLLWLDASEAGTLSRSGTDAKQIFDKAPGGYSLKVENVQHKPKILQSRFNGKTVIRFAKPPQFFIGGPKISDHASICVMGVINGKLVVDCTNTSDCISATKTRITIPSIGYNSPVEIAEMLVYDTGSLTMDDINNVCEYLTRKWEI